MRLPRLRRKRKLPSPDLSWVGNLDGWDMLALLSILDMLDD